MNCPVCHSPIPGENLNIQADIAKCNQCQSVFKISENLFVHAADGFNIETPPNGAWIKRDYNGLLIGASTRSPIAFFLVPFMLVWSGGALGGIYGSQIISGEFSLLMSLFGIPFILGTILFGSITLMAIFGKVEISMDDNGGRIFTGLGSKAGLTKMFTWDDIKSVKEGNTTLRYPGSIGNNLVLEGANRIVFGSGLNESRRYYVFKALEKILADKKMNRRVF